MSNSANPANNHVSERPIRTAKDDLLDRELFVDRLAQSLVTPDNKHSTGIVLGISGEWGSGKSSVLAMLAEKLTDAHGAIVVLFDPWLISGRDDLVGRLLTELAGRLSSTIRTAKVTNAKKRMLEYAEVLAPAISYAPIAFGGIPVPLLGHFVGYLAKKKRGRLASSPSLEDRKRQLASALNDLARPIVVLIDELDRLEDHEVRAIAQLVRAVADLPQISYALAYDSERVMEALGLDAGPNKTHRIARGKSYLEKIVQHQIPLPVALHDEIRRLSIALLGQVEADLALPSGWVQSERFNKLLDILVPGLIRTPRDAKRWIGHARVQGPMFKDEVDWVDVIAWAALSAKAPLTTALVRSHPTRVCSAYYERNRDEEAEWMLLHDKDENKADRTSAICAESERSRHLESLLKFLFPNLASQSLPTYEPQRIFNPRPLMTVLRNGLPPGRYPRSDIESALRNGGHTFVHLLQSAIADPGRLIDLVTRFYEVYPRTTDIDHFEIWSEIAAFLHNAHAGSANEFTPYYHLGGDLIEAIEARVAIDASFAETAKFVTRELEKIGDMEILPFIVWNHIWGHGLFKTRKRDKQPIWIDSTETERLARAIGQDAVIRLSADRKFIQNLWTLVPVYLAMWTGSWDPTTKIRLQGYCRNDDVLDSLVLLLFGGRYSSGKQTLDDLIGFDFFIDTARDRANRGLLEEHETLQAAYNKILRGPILN